MQIRHMQNSDLGMTLEGVINIKSPVVYENDSINNQKAAVLKNELGLIPGILSVSISQFIPGGDGTSGYGGYIRRTDSDKTDVKSYRSGILDEDFVNVYKMDILAGRNFSEEFPSDPTGAVLINETACEALGFESPQSAIGKTILFPINGKEDGKPITVIGVIRNYHQNSLKYEVEPMIFALDIRPNGFFNVRYSSSHTAGLIKSIEEKWNQFFPDNPFIYQFMDEVFELQYYSEKNFMKLFGAFSILAVIIASLGLFGLSTFMTIRRTKEIGIRKAMGASIYNIILMLSKEYLKLIFIAFVVAIPLSNYFVTEWLREFAYRIQLTWWLFLIPGFFVFIVALLSVGRQSVRASTTNPVKALRYE
jgi:putative ABC transport system permease protein